jgi:hypothetical protein
LHLGARRSTVAVKKVFSKASRHHGGLRFRQLESGGFQLLAARSRGALGAGRTGFLGSFAAPRARAVTDGSSEEVPARTAVSRAAVSSGLKMTAESGRTLQDAARLLASNMRMNLTKPRAPW